MDRSAEIPRWRRLFHWLGRPGVRLALAWVVAVVACPINCYLAWYSAYDAKRGDRNWAHMNIDFSGQWLSARMVVSGNGQRIYDYTTQQAVLEAAYPHSGEDPEAAMHDSDRILGQLMKEEGTNLSGPLYPPVHGLLFAPLGLLPPQPAFRAMQAFNLALTFVLAWLVSRLTYGRIWISVAVPLLFLYPGHAGGFYLGQNPILSATFLLAGWLLLREGRPWAGGAVWGLLAFKPVWALAFFLVPLLTRRWRFAGGMALAGAALVLGTLPLVGVHSWLGWFKIGRIASGGYAEYENWIFLSRDLVSVPRRWLMTFENGYGTSPYEPWTTLLGVVLWASVPLTTAAVALWRRREADALEGPIPAFIQLGCLFSCYHFMYYDLMVSLLPMCLLFTDPWQYWRQFLRRPWLPPLPPLILVLAPGLPPLLQWVFRNTHLPPYDMACLLVLWLWCGWQWLRRPAGVRRPAPAVAPEQERAAVVAAPA